MSSLNLIRWGGLAAVVGGALLAVLDLVEFALFRGQPQSLVAATGAWIVVQLLYIVAIVLIALGLVGAYARQAERAGTLGLIAFLMAFTGTVLVAGAEWSAAFIAPWLTEIAPPELLDAEPSAIVVVGVVLTFILFGLGWFLFGLASLQTKVPSRGVAVLLMIGSALVIVLGLLDLPLNAIVFGVAVSWMGYTLWSSMGEATFTAEAAM